MEKLRSPSISAHGAAIPTIGYGAMKLPDRPVEPVAAAIATGDRAIDTARKYGTEQFVGEGIRAGKIAGGELFVTTKVTEENAHEADFMRSIEISLKTLGLDDVNLLLVPFEKRHIVANLDIFDFTLSEDEMRRLSVLRKRQITVARPPQRAPRWDVETAA